MPKEMTHLLIADAVLEALPQGDLKDFLQKNHSLVRLGSVSYDTAFYGFSSRFSDFYDKTIQIHGQETDDITFPYRNVQEYGSRDQESAITAGALTHLCADSIFHPMIFYYSGWDLHFHYRMEAAMDLYFLKDRGVAFPQKVKSSFKDAKDCHENLAVWYTRFLGLEESRSEAALKLFSRHGNIQKLLFSPLLRGLTTFLALLFPRKFHDISGSFYRRRRDFSKDFYTQPIDYKYPVSGEERSVTLKDLFDQAVNRSVNVIQKWWENSGNYDYLSSFSPVTGVSPVLGAEFQYHAECSPDF